MSIPDQRQEKGFHIINSPSRLSIDTGNVSHPTPRLSVSSPTQFSRIADESIGRKGGVVNSPVSTKVDMKARATVGYRSTMGNRSTPSRPTARQSAPVSRSFHYTSDPMNLLPPISAKDEEEEEDYKKKAMENGFQNQICSQELLEQGKEERNDWSY